LANGYHAAFLGTGAGLPMFLNIPGENFGGIYSANEFLTRTNLMKAYLFPEYDTPIATGRRVAVIGGGNSAIDAARMALRLGASEVHIVYRRTRVEMPAQDVEVQEAEEEGVKFHFLTNPTRVLGDGKVTGLGLQPQELGEFDKSGRRRPVPIEGSGYVMKVDIVIPAIGQAPDLSCLNGDRPEVNRDYTFKVGRKLETSRAGVFAAGDAVLGPATVIEAVAQGNKVAMAVDEYLREGHAQSKGDWLAYRTVELKYDREDYAEAKRPEMPTQASQERIKNFDQIELGFSEEVAREEAKRCLRCDLEEF